MATSDTSRADGPPPFCATLQAWVERYRKSDGKEIVAVVEDVSVSLAVAAMRRAFEARRNRGQAQSGATKMTLTAIHASGVNETRPCDAKGTPYGVGTFSLLADEPVETRGDVVLRNDERARRNAGVAGGVPPDELQTLRGNKVRFAVEKQRAVDHTPVRKFRYEKRHTFVDGRFSTEMTKVLEGATAEEAKVAQPEFKIEIKYRCGGHERPARHPADLILKELADLIRHTTAPALTPAPPPPPRATERPVQNSQFLKLPDDLLDRILKATGDVRAVARAGCACFQLRDIAFGRGIVAKMRGVPLEGHTDVVHCVTVTPDGRIISGSWDRTLKAWAPTGGECLRTIGGHAAIVLGVAHVMPPPQQPPPQQPPPPPNSYAAAAATAVAAPPPMGSGRILSVNSTFKLWNLAKVPSPEDIAFGTSMEEANLEVPAMEVRNFAALCVVTYGDGEHVILGGSRGDIVVLNINTGVIIHKFEGNRLNSSNPGGHRGEVRAVTVTPDGQHIISCSPRDRLDTDGYPVSATRCRSQRQRDEYRTTAGTVKVWSVIHRTLRSTSDEHLVLSMAAMPDSPRYLSGGRDGIVRVWGLHDGNLQKTFTFTELHRWKTTTACEVGALVALPDNRRALAGWSNGNIALFNVHNGAVLNTFTHHAKWVRCLALLPDGHHFVSGSDDKIPRIVELPQFVAEPSPPVVAPDEGALDEGALAASSEDVVAPPVFEEVHRTSELDDVQYDNAFSSSASPAHTPPSPVPK